MAAWKRNKRLSFAILAAFVKERQAEDPNVFGPHGGFARAYALSDVLTTISMMAGPIVSGALHGTVGYYYMNLVFGKVFFTQGIFGQEV